MIGWAKLLSSRSGALVRWGALACALLWQVGCAPTIKVAPPDKPITINMNVKIQHEIRVKVDRELDQVLSDESGLF